MAEDGKRAAEGDGEKSSKRLAKPAPSVINVGEWIEESKEQFLPPVCNKMMHNTQLKIMFVGGPNERKDYHIEEGEELFYMVKGDMCLKVLEKGKHRDIPIKEGELFVLPARIPHSPQRKADTVGLVIERDRLQDETDGLRYFVEKDGKPTQDSLFERWFHCVNLGTQLAPIIKEYFASEQHKTGKPVPGTIPKDPPVQIDTSRSVEDPFVLSEWLEENKKDIDKNGSMNIFGDGYQFSVDMLGLGTSDGGEDEVETWMWQMEGTSTLSIEDGEEYNLKQDDCILIPPGFNYTAERPEGARVLVCVQDPSRKE